MKRVIALALVILTLFALAGCGRKKAETQLEIAIVKYAQTQIKEDVKNIEEVRKIVRFDSFISEEGEDKYRVTGILYTVDDKKTNHNDVYNYLVEYNGTGDPKVITKEASFSKDWKH